MPSISVRTNTPTGSLADRTDRRPGHPLTRVVDASLAGCLFVVPFLMGGRHPVGQAVLIALCVTAAVAWSVHQASRRCAPFSPTWLAPLLLLAIAGLTVQVIPLPESLLDKISPKIGELLPLWHSQQHATERLGTWQTLSLSPAATRDGLMLLSAYALLFLVTVQRAERLEDVERLLRWCAAAASLTAAYGLVQLLTSNGKFFWIYQHPWRDTFHVARGNFTNQNHFAQFLALGLGPLLWWVQAAFGGSNPPPLARFGKGSNTPPLARSGKGSNPPPLARFGRGAGGEGTLGDSQPSPRAQRHSFAVSPPPRGLKAYLLALCLGLVFFAGLLSLSRGGMAAIVLAAALSGAVCWRARSGSKGVVAALAGTGIVVALSLNIFGLDRVSRRIADFESCSVERLDRQKARRSIWTAAARGTRQFALCGTGVGTHAEAYPVYYSNELYDCEEEFSHAESSYLQIGLETGFSGLLLALGAVVCCGYWCVGGLMRARSARVVTCLGAVTGSLAASAAHALVDVGWHVPACMAMVVVLAACAARLWRHAAGPQDAWTLPRLSYLGTAAILLLVGIWVIRNQVEAAVAARAWDSYRASRIAMDKEQKRSPDAPADAARRAAAQKAEAGRIDLLQTVVRRQPDHARAHLDLAECYLRLFDLIQVDSENPMSLANVRDAVQRSGFPSRAALDAWLGRAVGGHARYLDRALAHARRAVALCPLQGRGYFYLAELCFLENGGKGRKDAYIEQAVRVRPFDGEVLYAAATDALLTGDDERWREYGRRAFQCGRRHQRRLMSDLIGRAPPEVLEDVARVIVREFQPDWVALRFLRHAARERAGSEPLIWLERYCAERAEADAQSTRGEAAAQLWREAGDCYAAAGDADQAVRCAQSAVASDPQSYEARFGLARALMAQGRTTEAEPHLRWCLNRRPNDAAAEARWKEALKGRLDQPRETTSRREEKRRSL